MRCSGLALAAALAGMTAGCGGHEAGADAACTPTAGGFGAVCATFIRCPPEAPYCVTPSHDEVYGFCTRACDSVLDCISDAGITACRLFTTEIPGLDGGVMTCNFECAGCPSHLSCPPGMTYCVPPQDAGAPDVTLVCD